MEESLNSSSKAFSHFFSLPSKWRKGDWHKKKKKIKPQTPNSTRVLECARTHFLHKRFPEERSCANSYSHKETKPPASLHLPLIPNLPPVNQVGTNTRWQPSSQSAPSAAVHEVMIPQQHPHWKTFQKRERTILGWGLCLPVFWEVCWVF